MKRKNKIQRLMRAVLLPCLSILACAACIQEEELANGNGTLTASKEMRVSFSVVVPSPVQTRATSALDEGAVNRVFILLFENTGGERTYRYRIAVDNISIVSNTQKTFYASLPVGVYDIVVLANATEIIANSGIAFGDTKERVLGALVETNTGKWDNSTIPMWGQMDNQTINEETVFTGQNAIPLIRMMAKIEIAVAPDAAGTNNENFALTDIRLYNYSSRGRLVPDAWPADKKAMAPTEPAGGYAVMRYPANAPLLFDSKIFYAYEAPAGGQGAAMASNTCLIIGGSYRGGATTYYRVDFIDINSPDVFLPLLRNHHYLVTIVEVVGEGYPTPDIAFETARSNMQTSVAGWNDGGMEEVAVDDQHSLEVSKNTFVFSNDALATQTQDNRLTIRTSVPGGWEIEKITDASETPGTAAWLTTSETAWTLNTPQDVYLFATKNTTGAERTAYIYIRAGQLSFRATVVQKELFDIRITNIYGEEVSELTFPFSCQTEAFNVSWTPASASVTVSSSIVGQDADGNRVAFDGIGIPSAGVITGGLQTYDVHSEAHNGDLLATRASKIDFIINNGSGIVTRSIVLRQYEPLVVPLVPSDLFLLDGGEKSIGIRSNTTWRVVDVMDPNHILVDAEELIDQTGGMNISAEGEKLSFRVSAITKPSNTFVYEAYIGIIDAQDNMYWIFIKASAVS